jgi:hemolysin activation/secretion protein
MAALHACMLGAQPADAPAIGPPPRQARDAAPAAPPGALRVPVRGFEITGSPLLPLHELQEIVRPFERRVLGTEDLLEIRHRIDRFLFERGFVNSGAVIPDQSLDDGVVRIAIVAGRLARIDVEGTRHLRQDYVIDRVTPVPGALLDVNRLRERLQLLQQDPLIASVQGELRAGSALGEGELLLRIEEAPALQAALTLANDEPPSVGGTRLYAEAAHLDASGHGDMLRAAVGATEGLREGRVAYSLPMGATGATLRMGYERTRSTVIEYPFEELDIESRGESALVGVTLMLRRSLDAELGFGLQIERRTSATTLLGEPFSLYAGANDGRTTVVPLRFVQHYVRRPADAAVALRSTLSVGIDAMGATRNETAPDGRFVAWLGQAQAAWRAAAAGGELMARLEVQFASRTLLPLERFAMGGATVVPDMAGAGGVGTVRGYRRNALVSDDAVAGSIEYGHPAWRSETGDGVITLAVFADAGRGWNRGQDVGDARTLASVGLGVRMTGGPLRGALYWGMPIVDRPADRQDLQDRGIHFALQWFWRGDFHL